MRRLSAAALLVLLTNCTSRDETLRLDGTATMLSVLDPRADKQLTKGFFSVEGSGRWTGRTFAAILKPPPTASRRGAVLLLRFGIPESTIKALHSVAISASVNGVALEPDSFAKAGEWDYTRDVAPSVFRGETATVEFTLDKALAPHDNEHRELGVMAIAVGFEAK